MSCKMCILFLQSLLHLLSQPFPWDFPARLNPWFPLLHLAPILLQPWLQLLRLSYWPQLSHLQVQSLPRDFLARLQPREQNLKLLLLYILDFDSDVSWKLVSWNFIVNFCVEFSYQRKINGTRPWHRRQNLKLLISNSQIWENFCIYFLSDTISI